MSFPSNAAGEGPPPLEGGILQILWTYPIRCFPEVKPASDVPPVEVRCQARMRIEERLEVLLAGMVPSSAGVRRCSKPTSSPPPSGKSDAPATPEKSTIGESKLAFISNYKCTRRSHSEMNSKY